MKEKWKEKNFLHFQSRDTDKKLIIVWLIMFRFFYYYLWDIDFIVSWSNSSICTYDVVASKYIHHFSGQISTGLGFIINFGHNNDILMLYNSYDIY